MRVIGLAASAAFPSRETLPAPTGAVEAPYNESPDLAPTGWDSGVKRHGGPTHRDDIGAKPDTRPASHPQPPGVDTPILNAAHIFVMSLQFSPHSALAAFYSFYREHQRCGELDSSTEGD
jgi:hypothetical protein